MICKSEIVKNTIGKKFLVLLFKPDSFVVQFTSHISDMIIYRNIRKIGVFLISKDVKMAYLLSRYKFLKKWVGKNKINTLILMQHLEANLINSCTISSKLDKKNY